MIEAIETIFSIVTSPWALLLDWLVRLSGRPSTFFVRAGTFGAAALVLSGAFQAVQRKEGSWLLDASADIFVVLVLLPWVLRRANETDRSLQAGSETHPLSVVNLLQCKMWALWHTAIFVGALPAVFSEGNTTAIEALLVALVATWLTLPTGGGKSAWARVKERRLDTLRPAFVGGNQ